MNATLLERWKELPVLLVWAYTYIDDKFLTLLFADDQVIADHDDMMSKLEKEYRKWGLLVNTDRTDYLMVGGEVDDIQLRNGVIKNDCCKYIASEDYKTGDMRKGNKKPN